MKVFISSTDNDLIEFSKAAHDTAWAKARAQFLKVLRTHNQPEGLSGTEAGL